MDEKQLSDFLAELGTELEARSRLKSKARQENKRLPGSQTRRQLPAGRYSFKTRIQLDPVVMAALRLHELLCEKFAATEGDRQDLWRALTDSFNLGRTLIKPRAVDHG